MRVLGKASKKRKRTRRIKRSKPWAGLLRHQDHTSVGKILFVLFDTDKGAKNTRMIFVGG